MGDHERRDPALASLDSPYDDPRTNPIAFLSTGAEDMTHDDYLVRRTDNGLRPEDAALPQPPQDPTWRPDADS